MISRVMSPCCCLLTLVYFDRKYCDSIDLSDHLIFVLGAQNGANRVGLSIL